MARYRSISASVCAVLLAAGCPAQEEAASAPGAAGRDPEPARIEEPAPPAPVSFRFASADLGELPLKPPENPMSLTASDGTGLQLVRLAARAVVEQPLAFTELRLAFKNPEDRVIEGHFRVTLPQGASISRFAMRIGDRWQEGEVVELQAARRAYEDFLHRRQDPALLEQGAGNEFTARVFPIPARGVKELILSYSQELSSHATPYTLPLQGLPELGELDVAVSVPGAREPLVRLQQRHVVPKADFVVPAAHLPGRDGLRNAELVVARVQPFAGSRVDEIDSAIVLFDTSASRALGSDGQLRLLQTLVAGLAAGRGPKVPLAVACFDQTVEPVFDGEAGAFGEDALRRIRERGAMGASDFTRALRWAQERSRKSKMARVILFTDGVATAGPVEGDALLSEVRALKEAGVERLDAIAAGGIRDDALLARLTSAGLARDGVVVAATNALEEIARRLTFATAARLEVNVEGASWWWPRTIAGAQPGDEVLVYAELPANAPVRISIGGAARTVAELPTAARPLLQRAWAQARIASLIDQQDRQGDRPQLKQELRAEIIRLSVAHRVLSPYTALLVLETEQDYARFHIDRKALAQILTVSDDVAVAVVKRVEPVFDQSARVRTFADKAPEKRKGESASASAGAPADLGDVASADGRGEGESMQVAAAPMQRAAAQGPVASPVPARAAEAPKPEPMPVEAKQELAVDAPPAPAPIAAGAVDAMGLRGRFADDGRAAGFERGVPEIPRALPYTGRFRKVMAALAAKKADDALTEALRWRQEEPGDVLALVALGEAYEALHQIPRAARAYGSLIDLFASRADLRRFAGERLDRLDDALALELAADTYAKAAEQRPDHPASHRLRAFALLKLKRPAEAFEAMLEGVKRRYPEGRFLGVDRILREDLGLIAAAWIKAEPEKREEILARLRKAGGVVESGPSLRFVLNWETDANDVDFHIYDAHGGHAYFSSPVLQSGGELYADVTTGYGPECFTVRGKKRATPYTLQAHYYSRGPMGYGMGKLQIIDHDGAGNLKFEERPFVIMIDDAFVNLGKVARR